MTREQIDMELASRRGKTQV